MVCLRKTAMRSLKFVTTVCSTVKRVSNHIQLVNSTFRTRSSPTVNLSTTSLTMDKKNKSEESTGGSNSNKRAKLDSIRSEFLALGQNSGGSSQNPDCSGTFNLVKDGESGIALLAIRNVDKKNCFSGSMMAQFADFLTEVEQWKEVRADVVDTLYFFETMLDYRLIVEKLLLLREKRWYCTARRASSPRAATWTRCGRLAPPRGARR